MVVAAAAGDHVQAGGQLQEIVLLLRPVVRVVGLEALQALGLERPHSFVPAESAGEAAPGVGHHRHSAGLPDPAGGFLRGELLERDEAGAVVADEPQEGVLGAAGGAPVDQGAGEMGAGDQLGGGLGRHLLPGDRDGPLAEPLQHPAVALQPAPAHVGDPGEQPWVAGVEEQAQHVQGPAQEPAAELDARDQPGRHRGLHGQEPVQAGQGVVVGEGQGREAGRRPGPHQGLRGVGAVRVDRVGVEINQGRAPRAGHWPGRAPPA